MLPLEMQRLQWLLLCDVCCCVMSAAEEHGRVPVRHHPVPAWCMCGLLSSCVFCRLLLAIQTHLQVQGGVEKRIRCMILLPW